MQNEASHKSTLHLFHGLELSLLGPIFPSVIHPSRLRLAINIKAQLLTGTYLTKARICKISRLSSDPSCPSCQAPAESVCHFVGECESYQPERKALLENFPTSARTELSKLSLENQPFALSKLILLGILANVSYHFTDFHCKTLQYLLDIHQKRQAFIDQATAHCQS